MSTADAAKKFGFSRAFVLTTERKVPTVRQGDGNVVVKEERPYGSQKRVRDFLSGINDPLLQSGIDFILSDASCLSNFEQTQQYLRTLVATRQQHNDSRSDQLRVASASTGHKDVKIEDRWYPINERKELSGEQK